MRAATSGHVVPRSAIELHMSKTHLRANLMLRLLRRKKFQRPWQMHLLKKPLQNKLDPLMMASHTLMLMPLWEYQAWRQLRLKQGKCSGTNFAASFAVHMLAPTVKMVFVCTSVVRTCSGCALLIVLASLQGDSCMLESMATMCKTTANHTHHRGPSVSRTRCCCSDWLAEDKAKAIADEKRRIEEEEANMLVGPELPAGVSQQDMGDYGGALLPGKSHNETITIIDPSCCFYNCFWVFQASIFVQDHAHAAAAAAVVVASFECACGGLTGSIWCCRGGCSNACLCTEW